MPVYSMTGYASGQTGPTGSHSDAETASGKPPYDAIAANDRIRQQGRRFDL